MRWRSKLDDSLGGSRWRRFAQGHDDLTVVRLSLIQLDDADVRIGEVAHEPEAVLEAVAILLELARHDKIRLDREVKRQIHEVLLYVAKRRGTDWRVRRKIRTHAIALGEFASDYRFTVIEGWRNVLLDEQMDDQLRENAAIIVATLGEKKEDVKKELVTTMHDKDKSFWRRYSAAMALINIDLPINWTSASISEIGGQSFA